MILDGINSFWISNLWNRFVSHPFNIQLLTRDAIRESYVIKYNNIKNIIIKLLILNIQLATNTTI